MWERHARRDRNGGVLARSHAQKKPVALLVRHRLKDGVSKGRRRRNPTNQ
jgi:hypothetical protein